MKLSAQSIGANLSPRSIENFCQIQHNSRRTLRSSYVPDRSSYGSPGRSYWRNVGGT